MITFAFPQIDLPALVFAWVQAHPPSLATALTLYQGLVLALVALVWLDALWPRH